MAIVDARHDNATVRVNVPGTNSGGRAVLAGGCEDGRVAEIVLIRHGETEWSAAGKHTSFTDLDLTPRGEDQARAVGAHLAGRAFAAILVSPRKRALRTAELARLDPVIVDDDLAEWNYG